MHLDDSDRLMYRMTTPEVPQVKAAILQKQLFEERLAHLQELDRHLLNMHLRVQELSYVLR